ncbi:hypothetical protein MKD38_27745 [Cupriavidus sp. WGlv3]|uniref:hypothetical protein n=1 Tax=Cupriavidus sp. WGlv3 TaxID=2919924 RepID=UPI002090E81C|nr:hypothetical protein [Cupriavidus sp. WGlv3]MCO4865500.1 hypothetical protein [Cupriavidus sp. WGlv3]
MIDGFSTKGNLHAIYQWHPMKETVACQDVKACVLFERGLSPRTAGALNIRRWVNEPLTAEKGRLQQWPPDFSDA